ncbi:aspartate aminotransferase family protein [Candidatus Bathyarchaeota archaeon]|nr:aspartate aminotransferase family protein [Candidatus Bathyarchaeota archaeon]
MNLGDVTSRYMERTPGSRLLYERAVKVIPGGVSHNIRFFDPYPFYTVKAKGAYIWDVDGNRYCDYWMGHTGLILGHSPDVVVDALMKQIEYGTHFGTANKLELELAEKVIEIVPCAEMVRFCNSGTEATMYAVRLARAYTGRKRIVKITGGWHGGNTLLNKCVSLPLDKPESTGIAPEEQMYVDAIPFNDLEAFRRILSDKRGEIACIIMEPMLKGCIPADREYLKGLREESSRNDVVLIFDEVITGFRLSLGGAEEYYNVEADMVTMGKILGGGLPIGAVAGVSDIMERANPRKYGKGELCWIGGGTFSANPLTMTAGLATIRFLEENKERVYGKIGRLGDEARKQIDKLFRDHGIKHSVVGLGSLLNMFITSEDIEIRRYEDFKHIDHASTSRFYKALMLKSIFFLPEHTGAISYAHSDGDIKYLIESTEEVLVELKQS